MQNINREILRIALPSIVSNITVPLLGLIDVAITGHLGNAAYIGAIAVGGMLFNIIYWMFAFLRMGTSGMTAQAYGAEKKDESEGTTERHPNGQGETARLLWRSLGIALGISLVLLVVQIPLREVALLLIAPEGDVADYARTYFNICIWGAPPSLLLFALTGWFIGMQNTRIPMLVAVVQNVANILLSLTLVYGLGMKIEGVATGTVLAQYTGLLTALLLLRHCFGRQLKLKQGRDGVFTHEALKRFFTVNRDIFLRTLCLILVHFFFVAAGAHYGSTQLAVNALLMQLFTLYSYFMDGFANAGEALVGKAVGARSHEDYHRTVRQLFLWGAGVAALFTLCYALGGRSFLSLLTNEPDVLQAASDYWAWVLLFPICGLAAFIWDGIYIGATYTRGMLVSVFISMLTFLALYYLLTPYLNAHALWLAFVTYLAMRGAVQTVMGL